MATTYQLSIDIADFGGTDSEGVLIEIRLTTAGGDILDYATASVTEFVEGGVVASGETDPNGQATFDLIATNDLLPASKYEAAIDVEDGTPYRVVFEMPDSARQSCRFDKKRNSRQADGSRGYRCRMVA